MKLFNDIDEIYSDGFYFDGREYKCTVCGKILKKETTMNKHLDKRSCHSERNVFKDTPSENKIYEIYKMLLSINAPNARVTIQQFRKKKEYTAIAKFFFFCHSRSVPHPMDYLQWTLETSKWVFPVQAVYLATQELKFIDYRNFRMKNGADEINEQFIIKNEDRLYDHHFIMLSLERGEVSYDCLSTYVDMDVFIDGMSDGATMRFENFLELYHN